MTCEHGIFYVIGRSGVPKCIQCEPPIEKPAKIGFLQPDGSLLSQLDMIRQMGLRVREAREKTALDVLAAAGWDGWEIITPVTGPDGWPKLSHRWRAPQEKRTFGKNHLPQGTASGNLE